MDEAPRGRVALVFTDIEGSTRLWQALPDAMRAALALHDATLRTVFARHGGYEFGTAGDSFKVAFATADAAVAACVEAQCALVGAPWEPAILTHDAASEVRSDHGGVLFRGLRVRMGVHLGPADAVPHPTTGRTDYFGTTVNAAARVGDAGHGGQIVVSQAVVDALSAMPDATTRPLGDHRLKGVDGAVALHEVLPAALASRSFPPLRTETARRTNVVARRDGFVGREAEMEALLGALQAGRITTLLGPGGTGKTRIASELATRYLTRWPGGAWFCDLAPARTRMDVLVQLASSLRFPLSVDVTEATAAQAAGRNIAALGRSLLVLDNFEQLVGVAASTIGAWADTAPLVTFLVTSREPLALAGERVVELPPLDPEQAEALFIERATTVKSGFAPGPDDRAAIRTVVERLDRLPLAIELAASRVDLMSPRALAQRLDQRFRLLATTRSDLTGRQATLRGALDWSWDLLTPWEQTALAQCAVFRGGFTLDAAESVIDLGASPDAPWTLDVIHALRRKSLLRSEPGQAEARLGLYETVLAYATEKLGTGEARRAVELRHGRYYAEVAEDSAAHLRLPDDIAAIQRLRAELDNVLAAHERLLAVDPAVAIRAIASISPALEIFGPAPRYLEMIDAAVEAAERLGEPELLVRSLRARGFALGLAARPVERHAAVTRARDLARQHGLARHAADLRREYAMGAFYGSVPFDEALVEIRGAARDLEALGMFSHAGIAVTLEANLLMIVGADESPALLIERGHALVAAHGGVRDLAWINQARLFQGMLTSADLGALVAPMERSIEGLRRCGDALNLGACLSLAGSLLALDGDLERARQMLDEAWAITAPLGAPGRTAAVVIAQQSLALRKAADAHRAGDEQAAEALLAQIEAAVAPFRAPGPPDRDHPDGTPSLAERSSAVRGSLGFLEVHRAQVFGLPRPRPGYLAR